MGELSQTEKSDGIEPVRVQKWLAGQGVASRREVERMMLEGRVEINGACATLGQRVVPGQDRIVVDGKTVTPNRPPLVYFLLNKPDRTLTSTRAENGWTTVYDLPSVAKQPFRLVTVGRLDYRSEGLLLLTNDGTLTHRLSHPRFKVEKHYLVVVSGRLTSAQEDMIRHPGVELEDGKAQAKVRFAYSQNLGATRGACYYVTISEGRNRMIRRIFEACNLKVLRLVRFGLGPLQMAPSHKPGELRALTREELKQLKTAVRG